MRLGEVVLLSAAGLLMACCASCNVDVGVTLNDQTKGQVLSIGKVPHQVIDWPIEVMKKDASGVWQVGECGRTEVGIYCLSVLPEVLETWKWQGATLVPDLNLGLPGARNLVFLPGGRYVCCQTLSETDREGTLLYASLVPKAKIKERQLPGGRIYRRMGSSRNAKYIVLSVLDNAENASADSKWKMQRARIALVDIPALDTSWVGDLPCDEGCLSETAVSEDGEYVAVTGCNNKLAVLSSSPERVLWHLKPDDDVVSHVLFSSDGLTLYSGGTSACVYAIETRTGKIVSRWHATRTGKPIYGHRIACLAISSDDRWVAAGTGTEGEVYLFDVTGKEKPRMLLHGLRTIEILSFSPDSKYLASVAGGKIKIWSVTPAGVAVLVQGN